MLSLALAFALFGATATAQPRIVEDGVTLARDVDATSVGPVHGLSIYNASREVFFIADGGDDLYRLDVDDNFTQIADDVGRFIGILSDLRVGPDGLIYVGDSFLAGGETNGDIFRFQRDGTFVDTFASVTIGGGSNAFGVDFDCADNLYVSETGTNLYRITPAGDVSVFSSGWVDVDEIERGENNQFFVLDGSARSAEWGTVFIHDPDGTVRRYAEGLPRTHSATFERGSGDLVVGTYSTGEVLRLRDANNNGTIEMGERSVIADGFGTNQLVDVDYGRSSMGDGYSLYVVASGHIYEYAGFDTPRFGGCGAFFDDDGDGVCDMGEDLNGDGDCDDPGEDTGAMDCDDTSMGASSMASEECADGVDNDCDGDVDLMDSDCSTFDTDADGIPDVVEQGRGDTDGDGTPDVSDTDDDGDGIPTRTECPNPSDCADTDGDDTPDYLDTDDDGDGILTATECTDASDCADTDGDDTPDYLDTDDDGDGVPTSTECTTPSNCADNDGTDGPDYLDPDDDGDGIPTATENTATEGTDVDGDDNPNYLDLDSDGDETSDAVEGTGDVDGDGIPNYLDPDDDVSGDDGSMGAADGGVMDDIPPTAGISGGALCTVQTNSKDSNPFKSSSFYLLALIGTCLLLRRTKKR